MIGWFKKVLNLKPKSGPNLNAKHDPKVYLYSNLISSLIVAQTPFIESHFSTTVKKATLDQYRLYNLFFKFFFAKVQKGEETCLWSQLLSYPISSWSVHQSNKNSKLYFSKLMDLNYSFSSYIMKAETNLPITFYTNFII